MSIKRTCTYCEQAFQPSRYHPNQKVCSSAECQRRRQADYHRNKLAKDPTYQDQCHLSQKIWRENNRNYMREYRAERQSHRVDPEKVHLIRELHRLQELAKNNFALELTALKASIWLLYPNHMTDVKNIFAKAKVIVIEGLGQPESKLKRTFL